MKKTLRVTMIIFIMMTTAIACQSEKTMINHQSNETTKQEEKTSNKDAEITSNTNSQVVEGYKIGNLAIDFTLTDLEDTTHSLSDYRGKTVLVNFFASWCSPCKHEMPFLNEVYSEYKDKDVVVLGVNLTEGDELEDVEALLSANDIAFPVLLDKKSKATDAYRVRSIPFSFIVDPEGVIVNAQLGTFMKKQDLVNFLEDALKEG